MESASFCSMCGGTHVPDPEGTWVDYEGFRFKKPFRCMCCGKETCARQFAFGRCCGPCDMGACDIRNRAFRVGATHRSPEWWDRDGKEMLRKFVSATGAISSMKGDSWER